MLVTNTAGNFDFWQGDTKGSARGGDGSSQKDTASAQLVPNAQVVIWW